jgi:nucleoside-diphosphate-sugar epimerase
MKALGGSPKPIVVLGSTSAYEAGGMREYPPAWIDESAPVDFTKARVKGEEYLRKEYGAILLRVAGIYGPGRNPLDWIRQGRVGPSRRYVNLIHVEDLAAICLGALEKGKRGEIYNVSDGTPRTWEEICEWARVRWGILPPQPKNEDRAGKRILTAKLRQELGYEVRRHDLYVAIEEIEARRA